MTAGKPAFGSTVSLIDHSVRSGDAARDAPHLRGHHRCALVLVQVIEQSEDKRWREIHRVSSLASPGAMGTAEGRVEPMEFLNWVLEPDSRRLRAALEEAMVGKIAWKGEVRAETRDGGPCRIDVEIHPDDIDGPKRRCTLTAQSHDHADHLRAEADAYRERVGIVEFAAELGIFEYDALSATVRLDEAAAGIHGLATWDSQVLPVESWAKLLVHEDQMRARTLLISGVLDGRTERTTVRLDGSDPKKPRMLELSLRSSPRGNGLLGACRDVTRERSVEALRRQKVAAERASQAKSDFVSHVSHELRTPLNAILGFTQLMTMDRNHPLAKPHRDRLEMVQHSGKRLLGLIDQLLQITKIERGKSDLRSKSVNVCAIVRHAMDALEVMASERGVEITVDIDRPELSSVRADPDALEQVVTNLLSNAIKYNRDRGRVRITFRAGEVGELVLDDTGKGLSDSQLGRMFEPFDRLDAEKSAIPGTGLGLVITKQLIEAMGGKLEVWSQVGKGSRFQVNLPLARGSRDTGSNNLPLDFPSQWATGRDYSVLYIEDDEVNVVLMEQLFSTQPEWQLRCASTGREGLTAAVRQRPHLILMDMNLPDMPGAEVFKRLRSDPRTSDIPCVAVSADALPARINRIHALGFEDYWTKPLDLPATIAKLKRLLR